MIDLLLWAAILVIFEGLIFRAARSALFADQAFTVSLAAPVACIVYMRWGLPGGMHACLAGLVYGLLAGGSWRHLAVYGVGNLLSLAVVPLMNRVGRERIMQSVSLSLWIALGTLLLMQLGRVLLAMLLLEAPLSEALRFFTTDSLSAVFTLVIIWIVRRLDGVYEDQRHYLRRFHQEQEKERMAHL